MVPRARSYRTSHSCSTSWSPCLAHDTPETDLGSLTVFSPRRQAWGVACRFLAVLVGSLGAQVAYPGVGGWVPGPGLGEHCGGLLCWLSTIKCLCAWRLTWFLCNGDESRFVCCAVSVLWLTADGASTAEIRHLEAGCLRSRIGRVVSSWGQDGESVPCSLSFGSFLAILGFFSLYKHLPISASIHPPCVLLHSCFLVLQGCWSYWVGTPLPQ